MSKNERFHVFIILPLFPAGSLLDLATRVVLRWIYKTINLIVRFSQHTIVLYLDSH